MSSPDIRWKQRFQNYDKAVSLVEEALARGPEVLSQLEKEGLMQRFEFTVELAWKTMKDYLEESGSRLETVTPKSVVAAAWQAPLPLQTRWLLDTLVLAHEAVAQTVPAGHTWHERDPEQAPVRPQVDGSWVEHSLAGSSPTGMGSQWPARPLSTQLSQMPPHRDSQQTPSVQNPVAQSVSTAQVVPVDVRHAPLAHERPGAQSSAVTHSVRQAPVPALQVKAPQSTGLAATQVPVPLQSSAASAVV